MTYIISKKPKILPYKIKINKKLKLENKLIIKPYIKIKQKIMKS